MSFLVILISFGYAMTLLCLAMPALKYMPNALSRKRTQKKHSFSIIIVYRNEIDALPGLLESIAKLNYAKDLAQWIFVNDNSSDGSAQLIADFHDRNSEINVTQMERPVISVSAKKDGITAAIKIAKFDYVITTDADCVLPGQWLIAFNRHYQEFADALLVAAPVQLIGTGFIAAIQQLEMMALQTITAGAFAIRQPFMCNGANLSFRKDAFEAIDGYSGNDHLSSGDDIFLLEKLAAEDVIQCHYLKDLDAGVKTASKSHWSHLINQRARWARKGKETKSLLNKLVAFHVAAMSLLFIISPILWLMDLISIQQLICVYLLKFFTDFIVLIIGNEFLAMRSWSRYFLPNFLIYPFVVIAIGIKSLGKLEWHGRSIDRSTDQ